MVIFRNSLNHIKKPFNGNGLPQTFVGAFLLGLEAVIGDGRARYRLLLPALGGGHLQEVLLAVLVGVGLGELGRVEGGVGEGDAQQGLVVVVVGHASVDLPAGLEAAGFALDGGAQLVVYILYIELVSQLSLPAKRRSSGPRTLARPHPSR